MSVANTQNPSNSLTPAGEDLTAHFDIVCRGLRRGRLTPVLGSGASLFGRPGPGGGEWTGAPSAEELASRLSKEFHLPTELASSRELLAVAQWISAMKGGSTPLYEELHDIFDRDLPTTPLHHFLAEVPGRLREKGLLGDPPLLVTTNYDDLLEQALDERGEPYDLVVYMADGEHHGHFFHQPPGGSLKLIEEPREYLDASPEVRTVVLKLHGFVNRNDPNHDSYVITEDHYIEYLTHADLDELLPASVLTRLLNCHLLFLGYSLRDWNLRAILYQLREKAKPNDWWAVRRDFDPVEQKTWAKKNVAMIGMTLEDYLLQLRNAFETWLADRS
ncbi:MAG: SIR2 family protein [Acidimicrobiales bacterium]|jgi:hypothetical protein